VDSRSTKGVLLWLACWARRTATRDFCPAFCCSSRPSTKYCFPRRILFPERQERGGLLLAVETEVNGDSKSTKERGPWLVRCGYLISFVPISQQARQAVVRRLMSLNKCLQYSLIGIPARSQKGSRVSIVHSCVSFGIS
jgi:hypothetical protein